MLHSSQNYNYRNFLRIPNSCLLKLFSFFVMKHINGANELACELSPFTYVPTHARWQTQLRRDPRHAYLRMNWRRSVEPVEFVRRPRRDPALYKVDRPMDHVFIRRTSSWYVSIHWAIEISSQHRPIYFWSRDIQCDICHVKSAECQVPLKKLIFLHTLSEFSV